MSSSANAAVCGWSPSSPRTSYAVSPEASTRVRLHGILLARVDTKTTSIASIATTALESGANGKVYNSASPRSGANTISYNYIHDTDNWGVNNPVFYSDSDQDFANYVGNMVSGVDNGNAQPARADAHIAAVRHVCRGGVQ